MLSDMLADALFTAQPSVAAPVVAAMVSPQGCVAPPARHCPPRPATGPPARGHSAQIAPGSGRVGRPSYGSALTKDEGSEPVCR